jgi:polar amino acid transport system substrate-binding protein
MRIFRPLLRHLFPVLFLAAAASAPAFAPAFAQEKSDLQKIVDAKLVRIGAVQAPPWYEKDLATGAWGGLVPEVMETVFGKIGVKVEYVETQWGTAVAGLQSNRFDLLGAYNATPERALSIDFTRPMGSLKLSILTLKDTADKYATWDKVNDPAVKLATVDGSGATRTLQPLLAKTSWIVGQSSDTMFLELESGRADALVTSDVQISQYLKTRGRGVMIVPTPVRLQPTNIGLRKSADPQLREWLNVSLDFMATDGTLERIWAKYVPAK